MTLAGAQMRIRQNKEGAQRDREVVDRLMAIRSLLMEIREELKEDGSAAVVVPTGADALQEQETVVEISEEPVEEPSAEEEIPVEKVDAVVETLPAADDTTSRPLVPFEQPLLPDESFALAMQVTVETPVPSEEPVEESLSVQPQKEQLQIIEQTLF